MSKREAEDGLEKTTKFCGGCKHTKSLDKFYTSNGRTISLCKECTLRNNQERRNRSRAKFAANSGLRPLKKRCSKCGVTKSRRQFGKRLTLDGLSCWCKECEKQSRDQRKNEIRQKLLDNPDAFGTTKQCYTCHENCPFDEFNKGLGPDGKTSSCRLCEAAKHYKRRQEIKKRYKQFFDHKACPCGEDDPRYLHAAHRDRITKLVNPSDATSIRQLDEELIKCFVLCVSCHQKETTNERKQTRNSGVIARRKIVNTEKMKRGECLRCKKRVDPEHPALHHFDHRNPETKIASICDMTTFLYPIEEIETEMEKCDLLCAKCHVDATKERRDNEWKMLWEFWPFRETENQIQDLAIKYNRGIDKVEEIVYDKMERQIILERAFGPDWIDHVVW